MAELRALVAVKRVIDFAVKVTGPPSPTSPCPAAVCFRGHEHTLYGGGVFSSPLISALCSPTPANVKVTPEGKDPEIVRF